MDIRYYLRSKGFSWTERDMKAIMNCPFCGDTEKKFAVSLADGAFNCLHLNRCGKKGSFTDLQKLLGDKPVRADGDDMLVARKVKQYVVPKPKVAGLTDEAVKFLRVRKFSDDTIRYFKLRSVPDKAAIAIPYMRDGKAVAIKYRCLREKKFWGERSQAPALFNADSVTGDTLIITEGEFDAMALHEYGIKAVSVPNGAQSTEWIEYDWNFLNAFQNIILCYDNDAAGESKIYAIANRLGLWRCYRCTLPKKDANECLMAGVPVEEIQAAIARAKDFCPVELLSAGACAADVKQLFANPGSLQGTPTPWRGLNNILKGWRDEEITVWSGRNGSGKSSMLNEIMIGLAEHGVRSCIATLEMPAKRIFRWMVMQYTHKAIPLDQDIDKAMSHLDEYIYFVNSHAGATPEQLLNIFQYASRKYGVKHFIIDSLMRVQIDFRDEYRQQTQFVSDLLSFAKEFNVHVHLVAHPRKGENDGAQPDKMDISGSGNITNLAHNVLMLWRPTAKQKAAAMDEGKRPPDTKLIVQKNREFGLEGEVRFNFDEFTKNFKEKII